MFLAISGIIIYFKLADNEILKLLMDLHIAVAVVFTINFLGFVFLAMDRFIIMMRNLLKIDFDMLGIGPFIPAPNTPLQNCKGVNENFALKINALARLLLPKINIQTTIARKYRSQKKRT